MNELIKEFAEQAGAVRNVLKMGRWDGVLFTEYELEMFAELIVKECAEIALREDHDPYECIKRHFGVK